MTGSPWFTFVRTCMFTLVVGAAPSALRAYSNPCVNSKSQSRHLGVVAVAVSHAESTVGSELGSILSKFGHKRATCSDCGAFGTKKGDGVIFRLNSLGVRFLKCPLDGEPYGFTYTNLLRAPRARQQSRRRSFT